MYSSLYSMPLPDRFIQCLHKQMGDLLNSQRTGIYRLGRTRSLQNAYHYRHMWILCVDILYYTISNIYLQNHRMIGEKTQHGRIFQLKALICHFFIVNLHRCLGVEYHTNVPQASVTIMSLFEVICITALMNRSVILQRSTKYTHEYYYMV